MYIVLFSQHLLYVIIPESQISALTSIAKCLCVSVYIELQGFLLMASRIVIYCYFMAKTFFFIVFPCHSCTLRSNWALRILAVRILRLILSRSLDWNYTVHIPIAWLKNNLLKVYFSSDIAGDGHIKNVIHSAMKPGTAALHCHSILIRHILP